jgi:hypothetical protein
MDFENAVKKVRDLVNRYDPENLIEGGASEDEYDAYINRIVSLQSSGHLNEDTLKQIFSAARKTIDYGASLRKSSTLLSRATSKKFIFIMVPQPRHIWSMAVTDLR